MHNDLQSKLIDNKFQLHIILCFPFRFFMFENTLGISTKIVNFSNFNKIQAHDPRNCLIEFRKELTKH